MTESKDAPLDGVNDWAHVEGLSPLIQEFLRSKPLYEQLGLEIQYTLEYLLKNIDVSIASVSSRVKTLKSFLEKARRKEYTDPMRQTTDIAGVRIVCLYKDELRKVCELVEQNFRKHEFEDKAPNSPDRFGYTAKHFVVSLGPKYAGPRYDVLGDLRCEIQIRTVLADAWAVIDHHMRYKHEVETSDPTERRIFLINATLEGADENFAELHRLRVDHVNRFARELHHTGGIAESVLSTRVSAETMSVYLRSRFPNVPIEAYPGQLVSMLEIFPERSRNFAVFETSLKQTHAIRERVRSRLSARSPSGNIDGYSAITEVVWAIAASDDALLADRRIPRQWGDAIRASK